MAWIKTSLIFPFLLALVISGEVHWKDKRNYHGFKGMTGKRLEKLTTLSDRYQFDKLELNPMLIERVPGTAGHNATRQFIKDRLKIVNWDIQEDSFEDDTPQGKKNFTNIIATQNPKSLRKLVLACHYDSKYFEEFKFIGATDSAVPCAMMLDLARSMDKYFKKKDLEGMICRAHQKEYACDPDVSLQFIFFDGEEAFVDWSATDSLYGARHLAQKFENSSYPEHNEDHTNILHSMDVLILLDLIGGANPKFRNFFEKTEKIFERFSKIENKLRDKKLLSATFPYFSLDRIYENNKGAMIEDDHVPFLKKEVPIVHLIAYPFPPQWHRPEDTKQFLDWNSIDDLNKIFRVFVAEYLHLDL